jgi:hypothetical protein
MGEEILNTTQCNLLFFHVYLALVQEMVFLNDSKKWFKLVFNYMHITQPPELKVVTNTISCLLAATPAESNRKHYWQIKRRQVEGTGLSLPTSGLQR